MKFLVLDNVYIKGKNIKNDPPSPIWLPLTCYLKSTHVDLQSSARYTDTVM